MLGAGTNDSGLAHINVEDEDDSLNLFEDEEGETDDVSTDIEDSGEAETAEAEGDEEESEEEYFEDEEDEEDEEDAENLSDNQASEESGEAEADEESFEEETEESEEGEPNLKPADERLFYRQMTAEAKAKTEAITGEEFDEFNPEHQVILAHQSNRIIAAKERTEKSLNKADSIIKENGGKQFQEYMMDYFGNLPARKYLQLKDAEAKGDYSKTIAEMEKAAEEFKTSGKKAAARDKAKNLNKKASKRRGRGAPPKTMPSGTGSAAGAQNDFSDTEDYLTPEELGIL
jgi:hypothetical protein